MEKYYAKLAHIYLIHQEIQQIIDDFQQKIAIDLSNVTQQMKS